jgi:adenylate cyclase
MCAWHYLDRPQLIVEVPIYGVEGIQMGDRFIPTDEMGQTLINYLGPPRTFPHHAISDILHGKFNKGTFKGKIVLVGSTALGIYDVRNTPFSPVYPGLEVHATIIDNILKQNFLTRPQWARGYDLLAIIVLGLLSGIALPRLSALKGLIFASGLFILHIMVARWLFTNSGIWLNIVYPLLVLLIAYIALTVYHYITEERERKKIRGAFGRYVSDTVIHQMLRNPEQLKLGGQEKTLTVLFCDLAGFTSYSEYLTPHAMIDLLSEYFEEMTAQIFTYEGTLKEYVGDELMAIFGAPLEQPDHAKRACAAALAMQKRLRSLREVWSTMDRPALRARTGVNSGNMLIGNLGSSYRFAYGALGDQVNLGSRLEGLNKVYGTEILIGENTAQLVDGAFQLRELDQVRVKGRKQPVHIYELLANAEDGLPKKLEQALEFYATGLRAYRQQRWEDALTQFQQVRVLWPDDQASRIMAERCRLYEETPPGEGWDGVFKMLTK